MNETTTRKKGKRAAMSPCCVDRRRWTVAGGVVLALVVVAADGFGLRTSPTATGSRTIIITHFYLSTSRVLVPCRQSLWKRSFQAAPIDNADADDNVCETSAASSSTSARNNQSSVEIKAAKEAASSSAALSDVNGKIKTASDKNGNEKVTSSTSNGEATAAVTSTKAETGNKSKWRFSFFQKQKDEEDRDFVIMLADPDGVVTDSLPIIYYDGPNARFKESISKILGNPLTEVVVCAGVLLSSLFVALSTLDHLPLLSTNIMPQVQTSIRYMLNAIGLVLVTDFGARWYASPKERFRHVLQPSFCLDILVVVCPLLFGLTPTELWVGIIPKWLTNPGSLINLELLRVLRLQRILKDMDTFSKFEAAIGLGGMAESPTYSMLVTKDWQLQLARVLSSLFTLLSVSSGLIYTAEYGSNPAMTDYFTALYFGLTTLTTVGFGDITPVTWGGKLVVSGSILAGVAIIPAQLAALVEALLARQEDDKKQSKTAATTATAPVLSSSSNINSMTANTPVAANARVERQPLQQSQQGRMALETVLTCSNCNASMHWSMARYCWSCGMPLDIRGHDIDQT